MGTRLMLRERKDQLNIVLDRRTLENALNGGGLENTVQQLRGILEESRVHDAHWLELIVTWTPKEGLPVKEQAKLYGLRMRLSELDRVDNSGLELSVQEEEEVWNRLNDERFQLHGLSLAWAAFVMDYCQQTGRQFATLKTR